MIYLFKMQIYKGTLSVVIVSGCVNERKILCSYEEQLIKRFAVVGRFFGGRTYKYQIPNEKK